MSEPIQGVYVWDLGGTTRCPRIVLEEAPPPPASAEEEIAWAALCAANGRLYNGPLLSVVRVEAPPQTGAACVITCRREWFKRLAIADVVPTGVHLLAVSGMLVARDDAGAQHVLLGRRSSQTRVYGGMWELAPSGGIEPPPTQRPGAGIIDRTHVLRVLQAEAREELSMELDVSATRFVALVHDERAHSDDLIVRVDLPAKIDPRWAPCPPRTAPGADAWEYVDAAWLPVAQAAGFAAEHTDAIIPPTRAVMRLLGWV